MAIIGQDIAAAANWLKKGQVVGIPTETVYGLAGNALDEKALLQIFEVKQRPHFDPLILHVASVDHISYWVKDFPEAAIRIAESFMPGPLTLVLRKKNSIPDLVSSGMDTVAIRVPKHPMTRQLLEKLDFPLAAPSANPFGYISPTTAQHVDKQLGDKIPYILDGGPCQVGVESTILDFSGETPIVLRKGGLPIEKLEAQLGNLRVAEKSSSNPKAPGMLESHYAPRIPLSLNAEYALRHNIPAKQTAALRFSAFLPNVPEANQFVLSAKADLEEAARNLFKGLRVLETGNFDVILAEKVPDRGLGKAINDRLARAAAATDN